MSTSFQLLKLLPVESTPLNRIWKLLPKMEFSTRPTTLAFSSALPIEPRATPPTLVTVKLESVKLTSPLMRAKRWFAASPLSTP